MEGPTCRLANFPGCPRRWTSSGRNIARVYDYLLGGAHNFEVDRELGDKGMALLPNLADAARFNRAFLHRAVRFCLDRGIRQFLDLGSGVPTAGNVHEVAQRAVPDARVVYVDIEPIAVAHSELPWTATTTPTPSRPMLAARLRCSTTRSPSAC